MMLPQLCNNLMMFADDMKIFLETIVTVLKIYKMIYIACHAFSLLYKTLFYWSIVTLFACDPFYKTGQQAIETLQKRMTRIVRHLSHYHINTV